MACGTPLLLSLAIAVADRFRVPRLLLHNPQTPNPGSRTHRSHLQPSVVYPLCSGENVTGMKERPDVGTRYCSSRAGWIGVAGIDDAKGRVRDRPAGGGGCCV